MQRPRTTVVWTGKLVIEGKYEIRTIGSCVVL